MGPGMVADEVTGGGNLADERGFGLGAAADQKEGGADIAAGENVEQTGRPDGVGAVVEGEGEFAGARRSDERGAEDLRSGPEGGVSEAARHQTETGGYAKTGGKLHSKRGNHVAI